MNNNLNKKTIKKGFLPYLFLFVIMLGVFYTFNVFNRNIHELTYNEFISKIDNGKVTELNLVARGSGYVYEVSGSLKGYEENESFEALLPLSEEVIKKIVAKIK